MTPPGRRPTVVVLGGINMDLIGVAPRLPAPGETVMGNHFYTAPGGKGANQAVAAARMGAHVRMIGRVGDDVFGPPMLDDLKGYGIDTSGISVDPDHASGIAMILLDDQRQNYIVAIYGANMQCGERELAAVRKALDGADVLMLQLETPYEVSLRAAQMANEMGVTVVWDPAPPLGLPPAAFAALDVVTPNQTEAEALTGIPVSDVESAHAAAEALLEAGASIAIVKLGELGACYASPEGRGHVTSHDVDASDTVAAGDAFGGAFTVALAEGRTVAEAAQHGTAAGALAVTKPGAQEAMPTRAEVEAMLAEDRATDPRLDDSAGSGRDYCSLPEEADS